MMHSKPFVVVILLLIAVLCAGCKGGIKRGSDDPSVDEKAMSRKLANGPCQVFGQLDNVDLKFGTITDDSGNEIELSHGNLRPS